MSDRADNGRSHGQTRLDAYAALEARSRQAFDDSVASLDAATLSRLNRVRQRALGEADAARYAAGHFAGRWRTAALGLIALFAVAVWLGRDVTAPTALQSEVVLSEAEDMEILLDSEELDMLAELEFYDWLHREAGFDEATDDVG